MIKLFEFQQKEIRTEIIGSDIWFSGQDVFNVLDLTWKGSYDLIRRGIDKKRVTKRSTQSMGGIQETIFIDEIALYKIVLRANKSEVADQFTDWVAELLVKIRKSIDNGRKDDLRKHLFVDVQKSYSKSINAINFDNGGVEKTIEYNRNNCVLHTGMKPHEIVEIGKKMGLKSVETSSAKQVLRTLKPELACAMSFTDKLVSENNIDHVEASKTSKDLAQPLFKKLMELGISQKELE